MSTPSSPTLPKLAEVSQRDPLFLPTLSEASPTPRVIERNDHPACAEIEFPVRSRFVTDEMMAGMLAAYEEECSTVIAEWERKKAEEERELKELEELRRRVAEKEKEIGEKRPVKVSILVRVLFVLCNAF